MPGSKLLFSAIIFSLLGCASAPVFHLDSVEEPFRWHQGNQIIKRVLDGITMFITYDDHTDGSFVFYVELFNDSHDTVLISPELFSLRTYERIPPDAAGKKPRTILSPAIPEHQIASINKEMARERSTQATLAILDVAVEALDAAATVTGGSGTTREVMEQRERERQLRQAQRTEREIGSMNKITFLEAQRAMWKSECLRKTTLFPGESIGGKVFFPVDPGAHYVGFVIALGPIRHEILYKQTKL